MQASLNSFKFEESGIMTSYLYVTKIEVQSAYLGKFELVWFLFLYNARDDWLLSEIQYLRLVRSESWLVCFKQKLTN